MLDFGYYNMDCMEGMAGFSDKYFDLAIVDPPYGQNYLNQIKNPNTKANWKIHKVKNWDIAPPDRKYFDKLKRISINQIIWGANHFINLIPYPSSCWVIWDKVQVFSLADFEMAWTSFKSPARAFRYSRGEATNDKKNWAIHPTQKPIALYRWLLQKYARPGDKLLDTHVGSASSLIAFEMEGYFDYVGFEIDVDYYRDSKNRLEQWRINRHPELFEVSEYRQAVNY